MNANAQMRPPLPLFNLTWLFKKFAWPRGRAERA